MKKLALNKPKGPNPFPKVASVPREKYPELMALMHKREKDGSIPDAPWPKPEITAGQLDKVAGIMADWDNNDPFAYGRTYLHLKQGYINGNDIVGFSQKTLMRRLEWIKEVEDAKSH